VAANYRLSPGVRFPAHLIDLKRALAWIRSRIAEHGGDPDFVVATGGSAGGHLAALLALSPNEPELQPGFEGVDTSVSACVPFYGVYDLLDRDGGRPPRALSPFLERMVMPCPPEANRELWDRASPLARVRPDAPPFFVIHGSHDSIALVEGARQFVRALRDVSRRPVVYAELSGAQHAFDLFHSVRCAHAVNAVTRFVEWVHARSRAAAAERAATARGTSARLPLGTARAWKSLEPVPGR
jgi:acetyl esterase/lipase